MSNFICSECGMTNIDCGGAGYKTPKEIELEKENEKMKKCITELKVRLLDTREARDNATKVANTYLDQIADLSKTIERLQEQLSEANKLLLSLKHHAICDFDRIIYGEYIDKWGVK